MTTPNTTTAAHVGPALRRAALLDRIALDHPTDPHAARAADAAAEVYVRQRRNEWDRAAGRDPWAFTTDDPTGARRTGREYARAEYTAALGLPGHPHTVTTHPTDPATGTGIRVVSFGYGHGVRPPVAHITVDLRDTFRNPHHDPAMRDRTGLDADVYAHVLATPGVEILLAGIARAALDMYTALGGPVVVATGCVGGRHRAVGAARRLADHITAAGVPVDVEHRDVHRPVLADTAHHTARRNPDPEEPNDPALAAAIERDNAREDTGMHGDDRTTCWTHQTWAEDCADDPIHTRPSAYHLRPHPSDGT